MELSQAHAIIYNHLLDLHRQEQIFRFLLLHETTTRFLDAYTSSENTKRDNLMVVSFWSFDLNTPFRLFAPLALYINIERGTARVAFGGDTTIDKAEYFREMGNSLGFNRISSKQAKTDLFSKELAYENNDYKKLISDFIAKEKKEIDAYLIKNDNIRGIMTISENGFNKNIILNKIVLANGYSKLYLNNKTKKERTGILKYLKVTNYQGIKSLTIDNLPNDAQWIFLTGENGYGKTSLLKAIAKGLLGDEELVEQINTETEILSCIITDSGRINPEMVVTGERIFSHDDFPVICYGISRFRLRLDYYNEREYNNSRNLFEDDSTLLNIERLFLTADDASFETLKSIFKKIIPNLADIKKEENKGFYEIRYQEKNDAGEVFDFVKLSDLAAGYRGIIIMIGDMIRRFRYIYQGVEHISGIVIIDEFDAHLHPKYQYELPKLLSTVFPKVQFIVSTHSPIPLLGVEPNTAVVLTVHRTKEEGITVERLDDDIDIARLSANALLTSDIFGFKSIFARGSTPDTIEPFDDYKDIKEMNELEKRMKLKQGLKDLKIKIA